MGALAKRQQFSCILRTATLSPKFQMWFQSVGFDFPMLHLSSIILLLYEQVQVRVVVIFLFFSGSCSKNQACGTTRYVAQFSSFFGGTTPTDCGNCSVDPKTHHPVKRSLAVCGHTGGVLRDFVPVFHRDTCREHSLIGRRNWLVTEAANSLSATAGPESSITMNPIANLASD